MSAYRERAAHAWTEDSVRLIATPSAFAKSSLFYVQEAGRFQTLENYFTEREQLDSYLIVYTVSGRGRLIYGGKTYSLKPNQIFFIDCMEYQYYATDQVEPWQLLWVHLNGNSTRAYYEQYQEKGYPVTSLRHGSKIPSIMRELIQIHRQKGHRTELISAKLLVELLTELLLSARNLGMGAPNLPKYIENTILELEQRFHEKITLDQLASHFTVSKYHLAKEFKRYTGFSPGEYLINTRITRATELLKYSDLSVADIAAKVGIENVSHFIHLFKDRLESTPLAFRKKWQRP